jgi:hypothetical protein
VTRRRGQSLTEFASAAPALIAVLVGFGILVAFLLQGWATSRSIEWIGTQLTSGARWGDVRDDFVTKAHSYGADVDMSRVADGAILVHVTRVDPVSGDTSTVEYGWSDTMEIVYGDQVRVTIEKPFTGSPIENITTRFFPGGLFVSSSWSGVAQRDTLNPDDAGSAISTGRITGTIRDANTGLAIAGVTVIVDQTGKAAVTDSNGIYLLTSVPAGSVDLTATSAGYAPTGAIDVNVSIAAAVTKDFVLNRAARIIVFAASASVTRPGIPDNEGFEGSTADIATRYATAVEGSGPTAYWRLGEASGGIAAAEAGADGAYSGSPTLGVGGAIAGDPDTAMGTAGDGGRMTVTSTVGNSAALGVPGSLTVELWVKATGVANSAQTILRREGTGGALFALSRLTTNGVAAVTHVGGVDYSTTANTSIADGRWHAVTLTHNGVQLRLFIDGSPVSSTAVGTAVGAGDLSIGANTDGSFPFSGSIDEVAVYSRVIADAEISAHAEIGRSAAGSTADWSRGGSFVATPESFSTTALYHHTGGASAKVVSGTTASAGISADLPGTFSSGTAYAAVAWVKGESGTSIGLYIGVPGTLNRADTTVAATGSWQRVEVPWTPLLTTAAAKIAVSGNRASSTSTTVYIDDVVVGRAVAGIEGAVVTTSGGLAATEIGGGWYALDLAPGTYTVVAAKEGASGSSAPTAVATGARAEVTVTVSPVGLRPLERPAEIADWRRAAPISPVRAA